MRSPLSVIGLQARQLGERLGGLGLHDEARMLEVVVQNAAFISGLVRELIGVARLESVAPGARLQRVPLASLVESVLARTVTSGERARVRLEIDAEPTVSIDPDHIERVIRNLVQNALQHSPVDRPVTVRVGSGEGRGIVSVIDRGEGLTREEASRVFDKYWRAGSGQARDRAWAWASYISKQIVQAHQGQIGVTSAPGEGSTFFFTIPLDRQEAPVQSSAAPGPAAEIVLGRLRGLRVLVVDDHRDSVSVLAALLGARGLEVSAATSAQQARAIAETHPPDIALLDLEMPVMGGLLLLHRLRDAQPGLPAVIMSGYEADHPSIASACQTAGTSYLSKPFDIDQLIGLIDRLCVARAGGRAGLGSIEPLPATGRLAARPEQAASSAVPD